MIARSTPDGVPEPIDVLEIKSGGKEGVWLIHSANHWSITIIEHEGETGQ